MVVNTTAGFKAAISNVEILMTKIIAINDNKPTMVQNFQKLDSVHDFGGSRGNNLATDALSKIRGSTDNQLFYDQMRFFFIQKISFPNKTIVPNIKIKDFSSFSYPGTGCTQRIVDDVENYCVLLAMQQKINVDYLAGGAAGGAATQAARAQSYNTHFLNVPLDTTGTIQPGQFDDEKRRIHTFFNEYIDGNGNADGTAGTGKINVIVDTPGDFSKVLQYGGGLNDENDMFAYVLAQESVHDSAKGKPTTFEPTIINNKYYGNAYMEVFNYVDADGRVVNRNQQRTYKGFGADMNFESNYNITLTGMKYSVVDKKQQFSTRVNYVKAGTTTYIDCILNSLKHPTNVPEITKAISRIIKGNTHPVPPLINAAFITDRNADTLYAELIAAAISLNIGSNNNDELIDFNFTKKRAGDGLQARIVQRVNSGRPLQCYKFATMGAQRAGVNDAIRFEISKLVLVTIDRVLFSYCVSKNIPVIFSGTGFLLLFKPLSIHINNETTRATYDGGNALLKNEPNNIQSFGGASIDTVHPAAEEEDIEFGDSATATDTVRDYAANIPYILFKLLPYILNQLKSNDSPAIKLIIDKLIGIIEKIKDKDVITYHNNGISCLYHQYNGFDEKLQTNDVLSEQHVILNFIMDGYGMIIHTINYTDFTIKMYVANVRQTDLRFHRSLLHQEQMVTRTSINRKLIYGIVSENAYTLQGGSKKTDNLTIKDMPSLNLYLDNFYNKPILSLDKKTLEQQNFLFIMSYISIFNHYEIGLCYDNEKYSQDFEINKSLEVSNKKELLLFFYYLLNEYEANKTKISYGLLEYYLNTYAKSNIVSMYMEEQIYYVYCSYVTVPSTVNEQITKLIEDKKIDTTDSIFKESMKHFDKIMDKVSGKSDDINKYLGNESKVTTDNKTKVDDDKNREFIEKYINMYGFLNMTNEFFDTLNPEQIKASLQNMIEIRVDNYNKHVLKATGDDEKKHVFNVMGDNAKKKNKKTHKTQKNTYIIDNPVQNMLLGQGGSSNIRKNTKKNTKISRKNNTRRRKYRTNL